MLVLVLVLVFSICNWLHCYCLRLFCRETQSYMVDSIVNLLREAEPEPTNTIEKALQPIMESGSSFDAVKDPLNSRYGVLLLKELCKPQAGLTVVCSKLVFVIQLIVVIIIYYSGAAAEENISHLIKQA